MNREETNKFVLLLLVIFVSALFISMIRQFLMVILLAGIFSALVSPVYQRLLARLRGRSSLASLLTVVLVIFLILLPLAGFFGLVTAQAVKVSAAVTPWVEQQVSRPEAVSHFLRSLPFYEEIAPYRNQIISRAGELVSGISAFLLNRVASFTFGTLNAVLMTFIMLYTMFFFLKDGVRLLEKILYYLPLKDQDERRMLDRFTSVARATLKGVLVIGALQGGLAGIAFAVAGIPSAAFWGTVMAVLSIIPPIGSALVWIPAVIILALTGELAKALGLATFCALVVGSVDNILRPILVGKDTQMHEMMVFFSTLGGLILFGMPGFIIGPIVAALLITVLEIYGAAFQNVLPPVVSALPDDMDEHTDTSTSGSGTNTKGVPVRNKE
ncbi:MAG TPA: AI-2E family transporter [Thermodesulfobacteriota bacterium]|nr:AI-2E family transporter [Deltaproteobacteria bacterium]HOC39462.1 AI-2E family transporter [Thermodesulfobacteriota bacterium]HQO77318.1 AI-2E family transporter [Thermodesulfobacteriota bacterium]